LPARGAVAYASGSDCQMSRYSGPPGIASASTRRDTSASSSSGGA